MTHSIVCVNRTLRIGHLIAALGLTSLAVPGAARAQMIDALAPKPTVNVLDDMSVDLKSGLIVRQMGGISIGPAESPVLAFPILSTSFIYSGPTPIYGMVSQQCASYGGVPGCVYSNWTWSMQGESETYISSPPSQTAPRGFTEQGSIVSGYNLIRRDGTVWQFGDPGGLTNLPANVAGVLLSVTYPNGEVLTHNYSGGMLQSITSNTGYMIHFENFRPYLGGIPSKVVLINLNRDYCAPTAATCSGLTLNWPSATFTITESGQVRVVKAKDNLNRESSRTTTTVPVSSPSGMERANMTFRYVTPEGRWSEYQRLLTLYSYRNTDGTWCNARSVLQWAKTAAGQWNYTFPGSDACQYTRVSSVVSTAPDGVVQKGQYNEFYDGLNRKTSYYVGSVNSFFGPIEVGLSAIVKPEGDRIDYRHDERNNPTEVKSTDKQGAATLSAQAFYGPTSACTAATAKVCNKPEYSLDPEGNRTDYTYYPEHGGVRTKTLPPDENGVRPQLRYRYEQKSARYKNVSGTLINGSPVWKLTEISQCKEAETCAGSANEIITTYVYNDSLLPTTTTVRTGDGAVLSVITKTYDPVGNVTEVDGPLAGDVDKVYAFYDDARQRIGEIGVDPDGTGPLLRTATRLFYNLDGQVTRDESGTTNGTTRTHLDSMSLVRYTQIQYDDELDIPTRESVVADGVTQRVKQYSHDVRGRVVCTAIRMNPSAYGSLPADACALSVPGAYGPDRITRNAYNAAGELIQIIQGYGTADQRAYATYRYSGNGLVTDSIDANGNRTHLTYDGFDRLDITYYPSASRPTAFDPSTPATALATAGAYNPGDFEQFGYDNNGNRRTWRRRDGVVIGFEHDALNRQTLKNIPNETATDVYTGYDLLGNVSFRRFGSKTGPGVSYVTDGLGRVTSTTDMNGRTVGYRYNAASARMRLIFPDSHYIGYTLDDANRMTAFGWNALSGLYSQAYNNVGQLSSMTKGAGATGFDYHSIGTLASVSNDLAGTANDVTWSFPTYNPAGQIMAQNSSSETYDFLDGALSNTSKGYDGLNRDAGITSLSNGYDARGNLTHDGTRTFTYDLENRLLTATGGAADLTLTYDPEGRISKYRSGSTETTFLYDGVALIAEYNSSGMLLRRYIHGEGVDNPVVTLEGTDASDRRYFYTNHQGSVIALADAAGTRQGMFKYGPYGEPKDANNNDAWAGPRFRYTGQIVLPEAKLYHYKARVYDPGLGRFLQTDPIGSRDDLNLYAYVGNDPVNYVDPAGLKNCYPDEQAKERCVETPESEQNPDPVVESTDEARKMEEVVVTAHKDRMDLQGGAITWTGEDELGYQVTYTGLQPIKTVHVGSQKCKNGKTIEKFSTTAPAGSTRAHTHPSSYGTPGRVPGPGDNIAALASHAKVAFMMSANNVFMIEAMANGTYRVQVSSGQISESQRAALIKQMRKWENPSPQKDLCK